MRVLFAGGGTGGHIFPALALAGEIRRRRPGAAILFVGTRGGLENRILPQEGYDVETLRVAGIKGKGPLEVLTSLALLPAAAARAWRIVRAFRPGVVVGVGGYAAGPVVLAAAAAGVPAVLQEQNSVPGLTNRILGRAARRIYTAYPEAALRFPRRKVVEAGNPVRPGVGRADPAEARRRLGLAADRPVVLVLGGSRGARGLNQAVCAVLAREGAAWRGVQFLHQTGAAERDQVRAAYASAGVPAVVEDFFRDMAAVYAAADLALSRAGAVALAELAAAGLPALLVPFPYAADDHQRRNAEAAAAGGGARILLQEELTPARLAAELRLLLGDEAARRAMAEAARRRARPRAAERIVDDLFALAGG